MGRGQKHSLSQYAQAINRARIELQDSMSLPAYQKLADELNKYLAAKEHISGVTVYRWSIMDGGGPVAMPSDSKLFAVAARAPAGSLAQRFAKEMLEIYQS